MNGVKNIVRKELKRVFSDKKMIFSLFIMPVIIMIGIYALIGKMQSSLMNAENEHIPVIVIQNAPEGFSEFIDKLDFKGNITYQSGSQEEKEKLFPEIKDGSVDLLVDFDKQFIETIATYKKGDRIPEVRTYYNPSGDYSGNVRNNFIEKVLNVYQKNLLSERIGDLESILIFEIDKDPSSSVVMDKEKASGKALGLMLPYMITMLLFAGAMSLGVDAITGEKERGTLASMLITPIKRGEIVLGKLISLSILSTLSAAVYAVSLIISIPMMLKSSNQSGMENMAVSFSILQIFQLLVIMLVMVFLYVTIVVLISVFARTSKEAGTYVSPIYLVVIVAGMITMFSRGEAPLFSYWIPIYGNSLAIQKLLSGELTMTMFSATIIGTGVTAILLTIVITKAFNSEKVMFNA